MKTLLSSLASFVGLPNLVAVGLVIAFLLGGLAGSSFVAARKNADIAMLEKIHAQTVATAEATAREALEIARNRGDALSRKLIETESALNAKSREVSHEIAQLTSGRPCLDGRTVRVLNDRSTSRRSAADSLPKTPGAPAPADGGIATDTHVAGWINYAQSQYDVCRTRLDALIDFEEGK